LKPFAHRRLKLLLCGCALMATTWMAAAAPILDAGDPLHFFTNVATRLLSKELNLNLTRIQIYPTNQYTPAVHRLLQVAANIYDATTNSTAILGADYPSVFRPLFTRDISGNVFITGYTNVLSVSGTGDATLSAPFDASQLGQPTLDNIPVNIYGVPWIIGAKKGFPNFNEISMECVVQIARKLQVTKSSLNSPPTLLATNEMYVFSISNSVGIEFWNSYTNNYTNALQVFVYDNLTVNLTNEFGFSGLISYPLVQNSFVTTWPRSTWFNGGQLNTNASYPFYVPLNANIGFMTNSVYKWLAGGFQPAGTAGWETGITDLPPLPHFGLLTTNRLQALLLATDSNGNQHVIDYVHFNGPNSQRDLNAEIQTLKNTASYDNMWATNKNARGIPWGIASQLAVSQLALPLDSSYWPDPNLAKAEIDGFYVFMGGSPAALPFSPLPAGYAAIFNAYTNSLTVQVPFTPQVTAYEYTTWQANDPLVHSLSSDLAFSDPSSIPRTGINVSYVNTALILLPNIGALNNRYQPWGKTRSYADSINNPYNSTIKDPLVRRSDDWAFPDGSSLNPAWLGKVHRGTPWQTIYLKSTNILGMAIGIASGVNTWKHWTGISDLFDVTNTAPVRDRRIASLFAALLNTNELATQFSVNSPDPNAWRGLLNGLTAYTNLPGQFGPVLITSNSPEALLIANGIQSKRSVQSGQLFRDVGDIFATPELAEKSPFLAGLNLTNNITDEACEIIPSQLLSLLRADSIGSAALIGNQPVVQFTGYDGHAYAIQASSDLANWESISTNCPLNGVFNFTNPATLNANQRFYRSVLLP
jgi:hypothetical protein